MLEFLLILYILLVFVYPLPMLGLALCLGIAYFPYREYQLLTQQPVEGRRIIWLYSVLQSTNWFLSFLLSLAMASGVHLIFVENRYLFLFNLIFSLAISVRWFNFTHKLFRHFISKWLGSSGGPAAVFAVCLGFRDNAGVGFGAPAFMDAGHLLSQGSRVTFSGLLFKHEFLPEEISQVERKSSEKIKVAFSAPPSPLRPDTLLIVLKDQFYPFKSRPVRDEVFRALERTRVDLALR